MSTTTETAPDSCPFCGAERRAGEGETVFECGTWNTSAPWPRKNQTIKCIEAERERLTRELSESKATIKRLETEKAFLSESHLAQENKRLAGEMLELRNAIQRDTDAFLRLTRERDEAKTALEDLQRRHEAAGDAAFQLQLQTMAERDNLLARVKRLEKDWDAWPDLQREWFGDKYAAMQPLEAVRARIEDSEDRIKRLEEAGGRLRKYLRIAVGPNAQGWETPHGVDIGKRIEAAIADWDKAKEAQP